MLLDDTAVVSCLIPALRAEGRAVRTVEGLGDDQRMHPLQEAFRRANASQYG